MEENLMKRSDHGGAVMKKEKRADSSGDEETGGRREEVAAKVWILVSWPFYGLMADDMIPLSSSHHIFFFPSFSTEF